MQKALREGVRAVPVLNARNQVVGILTDNDLRRSGVDTNLRRLQQMNGGVARHHDWPLRRPAGAPDNVAARHHRPILCHNFGCT